VALMLIIVIGYREDTGEAIDGFVTTASDERNAIARALAWVQGDANALVGSWRCFEYRDSWGPGREIFPDEADYGIPTTFYVVGVTETCKRLAICATERQAAEYIESLPGFEQGIYYIDECREPVMLDELTLDDL